MALKSFRDRNVILVGLVSLVVLGVLVVGVFLTGTMGLLKSRYTVTGVFADTGGIRKGNQVRMAGVRVGEVTAVKPRFDRGDVIITWKVDSGVNLGPTTRAEIRMENVLGGRFLRLSGPVAKPYLADLPEDKRRIPADRTGTPTLVNDLLKKSTRAVSKLDSKAFNKLLSELNGLNRLSSKDRGRLSRSLRNLTALADTINENDPKIKQLLDNSDRIMSVVSDRDAQLSQLLASARAMLAELRQRRAELATFLGSGHSVVKNLTTVIEQHEAQLTATMRDLRSSMRTLRPETDNLNTVLAWAGPTLTGLANAGGYGPWAEIVATGLGPLSGQDLADLAKGGAAAGATGTAGSTGSTGKGGQ